jgi:hypothetical protein
LNKINSRLSSRNTQSTVDDLYIYLKAFTSLGIYTKINTSLYVSETLEAFVKIIENSDLYNEVILNSALNNLKNFSENPNSVRKNCEIVIGAMLPVVIKTSFKYIILLY